MRIIAIDIFESLGYINPTYIEEADEDRLTPAKPHLSKTARILLIAAILISMMGAIAYGTGLFGLQARLIRPSQGDSMNHELSYISLGGISGSEEYAAAKEWIDYCREYEAHHNDTGDWRDLDRSFAKGNDVDLEISRIYGVWDETMLVKLKEIVKNHGLRLHTNIARIDSFQMAWQYENGAFIIEGIEVPLDVGKAYADIFVEAHGTLSAANLVALGEENVAEWVYTTTSGTEVSIISWPQNDRDYGSIQSYWIYILADGEMNSAVIKSSYTYDQTLNQENNLQLYAQTIADAFNFHALCWEAANMEPGHILR